MLINFFVQVNISLKLPCSDNQNADFNWNVTIPSLSTFFYKPALSRNSNFHDVEEERYMC